MCECNLFMTDADSPVQVVVFASIDYRRRLVVEYRCEYDNAPSRDFTRCAIVDEEDTLQMAAYYKIEVEKLPRLLFERSGIGCESVPSEANDVFKEALDVIIESGVRYKMSER